MSWMSVQRGGEASVRRGKGMERMGWGDGVRGGGMGRSGGKIIEKWKRERLEVWRFGGVRCEVWRRGRV